MNVSKTIIQALIIGASLQSCVGLVDPEATCPCHPEDSIENACDHTCKPADEPFDCPACGMG